MSHKITVSAIISADAEKVWNYYTHPEHITQWNFADPSWQCPSASNDMKVGGKYVKARMGSQRRKFRFSTLKPFTMK